MAREEQTREDLLAEATALAHRIELRIDDLAEPVVIGFRASGAASIYWGESPAYHFNATGELRRAFVAGTLYKAENRQLVAMRRQRSAHETVLASQALSPDAQRQFMTECQARIAHLRDALSASRFSTLRQVPQQADVLNHVQRWLQNVGQSIPIASSPRVD